MFDDRSDSCDSCGRVGRVLHLWQYLSSQPVLAQILPKPLYGSRQALKLMQETQARVTYGSSKRPMCMKECTSESGWSLTGVFRLNLWLSLLKSTPRLQAPTRRLPRQPVRELCEPRVRRRLFQGGGSGGGLAEFQAPQVLIQPFWGSSHVLK